MENKMVTTWALAQNKLNEADYLWLKGTGVEVEVETLYNSIHSSKGISTQFVTGYSIRIKTTCEKQETMLQLKYGDKLHMVSRSMTDAELKEINF